MQTNNFKKILRLFTRKNYFSLNVLLFVLLIIFFIKLLIFNNKNNNPTIKQTEINFINSHYNNVKIITKFSDLKIINLSEKLEPAHVYDQIECRTSKNIYVVTTLCIHSRSDYVSGNIWNHGIWEEGIVRQFLEYIYNNPNWFVFDIGANLGVYTLYAAKMGRKVLSVEPFYDNQIRLHKASKHENIQDNIILIGNALSNKRNELKRLKSEPNNIGGQSLLPNKDKIIKRDEINLNDKYIVETILFDDIVSHIPKTNQGYDYKEAIMKIDIESFEPYAFQHAKKLFDRIDIKIIFMEWIHIASQKDNYPMIEEMLEFLYSYNLIPYTYGGLKLERINWKSRWPMDIVWKKNLSQ